MKLGKTILLTALSFSLIGCGSGAKVSPSWPSKQIDKWLKDNDISGVNIPGLPEGEFTCEEMFDTSVGSYLEITAEDDGTPGKDAFEDKYVEILSKAKWDIDDSDYDTYGYVASEATEQVMIQFFNEQGMFVAWIFASGTSGYTEYGDWPTQVINDYLHDQGVDESTNVPSYDKGNWYGGPTYSMFGEPVFELYAPDDTTIYYDLIDTFVEAGWDIDDSYADFGFVDGYDPTETVYIVIADFSEDYGEVGVSFTRNYPLEKGDWPSDVIDEFFADLDIEGVDFPTLDGEFSYAIYTLDDGSPYISISANDDGEIGVDSYEDVLLEKFIDADWSIDDSLYDIYGYFAVDPTEQVEAQFYSYEGEFILYIYAYESEAGEWPSESIDTFLSELNVAGVTIPSLEGEFSYRIAEFEEIGMAMEIYALDSGTPGTDSYEDEMVTALSKIGWTIDDTYYEEDGYYADDPTGQVEMFFFSYDGEFYCYIYLQEGFVGGEGATGEENVDGNVHTVSLNFTTMQNEQVFTSQTVGDITFSCKQTTNKGNSPTYYSNRNTLRLYWGNAITITPTNGVTIQTITMNYDTSDDKLNESFSFTNATYTSKNGTLTITPVDGTKAVELEVGGSTGRLGLTSVVVTYTVA